MQLNWCIQNVSTNFYMSENRDNFHSTVIKALAKRASYICSNPKTPTCVSCGSKLVADENASSVYTNVICKGCESYYGMTLTDKCHCGRSFEI